VPQDDDLLDDEPTGGTPAQQQESSVLRELRKQQREQARQIEELKQQASAGQAATRELAMLKAGIDPQAPGAQWFLKGYDGELEPDKIREAAGEALLRQAPQQQPQQQPAQQQVGPAYQNPLEAAGWGAAGQAAQGAPPQQVDHLAGMHAAMQQAAKTGQNPIDAMTGYMLAHNLPVAEGHVAPGMYVEPG
jgi:hypothetical protein